jgi:hypothetical protein
MTILEFEIMFEVCSEPLEGYLRFLTREIYSLSHWTVLQVPKMDGMNVWLVTPNSNKFREEIKLRI